MTQYEKVNIERSYEPTGHSNGCKGIILVCSVIILTLYFALFAIGNHESIHLGRKKSDIQTSEIHRHFDFSLINKSHPILWEDDEDIISAYDDEVDDEVYEEVDANSTMQSSNMTDEAYFDNETYVLAEKYKRDRSKYATPAIPLREVDVWNPHVINAKIDNATYIGWNGIPSPAMQEIIMSETYENVLPWINFCSYDKNRTWNATSLVQRLNHASENQYAECASFGRVGSKASIEAISVGTENKILHTHRLPSYVYEHHGSENRKVLYIVRDPVSFVLSCRQLVIRYGCDEGSRWLLRHLSNMYPPKDTPESVFYFKKLLRTAINSNSSEHCDNWLNVLYSSDVIGLEHHITQYLSQSYYPTLYINFDKYLTSSIPDAISYYFREDEFFLEEGLLFQNMSIGHNVTERWDALTILEQNLIYSTYNHLSDKVRSLPDHCFFVDNVLEAD